MFQKASTSCKEIVAWFSFIPINVPQLAIVKAEGVDFFNDPA